MADGFFSNGTFSAVATSISLAPATSLRMSRPAIAIGTKPTGVSTEKRPPTLSGITNVLYPSWFANVRKAPLALSVMAIIFF